MQSSTQPNSPRASLFLALLNPRRFYHRAELAGAENLPASGGAVIVSNHGRLAFDAFILVSLILRASGRLLRLMADHMWFRLPVFRSLFANAGAVDGTRENALRLLVNQEPVLTYPGGAREVLGSRFGREEIDWRGRTGFAHVAIAAGVPIIPVAGFGVNSGYVFLTRGTILGTLLYRVLLRLGPAYASYRDPLTIGILPVPLPLSTAVHFPLPCKLRYVVGDPVYPETTDVTTAPQFADRVADTLRGMLARGCRE